MLIHAPGDSWNSGSRDEDGCKDERDGDHRPSHLLHCFFRCRLGVDTLVDVVFYGFHNDDGVVNNEANGKNKTEEKIAC